MLRGMIGARLEELPLPDRELLQCAAIVGETFTPETWRYSRTAIRSPSPARSSVSPSESTSTPRRAATASITRSSGMWHTGA